MGYYSVLAFDLRPRLGLCLVRTAFMLLGMQRVACLQPFAQIPKAETLPQKLHSEVLLNVNAQSHHVYSEGDIPPCQCILGTFHAITPTACTALPDTNRVSNLAIVTASYRTPDAHRHPAMAGSPVILLIQ